MAIDANAAYGPTRPKDRDVLLLAGEGVIAETVPRLTVSAATAIVGGTIYFIGVGLQQGDVVATMSFIISTTAGTGMTASKMGLYTTAGVRLAVSADQGAAWETTGLKTVTMVTPYTVQTAGMYYAALIATASVTLPTVSRTATQSTSQAMVVGTAAQPLGTMTGQTDLITPATVGATSPLALWIGVS